MSFFTTIWNEALYRPIYNLLVWLMDILPNHSFGWAIIIITIIIKLIVLIPSQKSIRSQQALQLIQPEITKIREEYKGNQQMIATKTMELYKKHGVHPMGGCLPLLIQLPVLIALFHVAQNGLNPNNAHFLYAPLKNFDFTQVNTMFLGTIDMVNTSVWSKWIMPITIGVLQFLQMFRMNHVQKKSKVVPVKPATGPDPQAMQRGMMYFMPLMIAYFAMRYPAALSLYWGTSTLFTIIQQEVVLHMKNKKNTAKIVVVKSKKGK